MQTPITVALPQHHLGPPEDTLFQVLQWQKVFNLYSFTMKSDNGSEVSIQVDTYIPSEKSANSILCQTHPRTCLCHLCIHPCIHPCINRSGIAVIGSKSSVEHEVEDLVEL